MPKISLILIAVFLAFSLSSCGGGSSSPTIDDGSETDGSETDGGETDGGETDGGETDGGETDGGETGGSPTTSVLLDETKTYPVLGQILTRHLKITERHLNNDGVANYNLWAYSYSPTKIDNRITFESYSSSNLPSLQGEEFYEQLAAETIYTYSPWPVIPTDKQRKMTHIGYAGGEAYLSGIIYDTLESLIFDDGTPPALINSRIKKEPELIAAGLQQDNPDFCAEDISTGEIDFSATGYGFWQIGDSITIENQTSGPIVNCDENGVASIDGSYELTTTATDTLTGYYSQFSLRGRDFHNVLEFSAHQVSKVPSGEILHESRTKTYLQFHTGEIAEVETSCLGGINSPDAICNTTDTVATNVPTFPEL